MRVTIVDTSQPSRARHLPLRTVRRPETGSGDVGQNGEVRRRHLWDGVHGLCTVGTAQEALARTVKDGVLLDVVGPIRDADREAGRSSGLDCVLIDC